MKMKSLLLTLSCSFFYCGTAFSEPNEKALRYHSLLLKKPGNAMVFGRFVEAWLDTGSKEELGDWLETEAKEGGFGEWRVLAAYQEYSGEEEAALNALNEAVKLDGENAELRLARAKLQAKLLAFEAALEDLKLASLDEKVGVEASKLQGIYLARSGQIEEAVTVWKGVIERFPKDEALREDLIEVQVMEGLYDDAIESSGGLVAMTKDPYQKALRQLRLGDVQILGGKKDAGLETYQEILAASGEGSWLEREVLAQVERVYVREDNVQGLRDFYQKLREAFPQRVSIRKSLARQMARNDEMNEAVALFREVLKLTPGDEGNREEFVAFLEANEKWKEAKEEIDDLLKASPEEVLLWERLAKLEKNLEDAEGLKVALQKVTELRKGQPDGLIAAANLWLQADLVEEAEALLREGWTSYPDSQEVKEALASLLMQNKKEEEALEIWKAMAETADREGLLRVARSLSGHGKGEEAFDILQSRSAEFSKDALVLAQLCQLAMTPEDAAMAIPFGLELVRQAEAPSELESAIKTAGRVIARGEKIAEMVGELEGRDGAGIGERCLLAELYAEQGDSRKGVSILEAAEAEDDGLLARFYRVHFEESQGNIAEAIKALRAIVELPEGRKTVHLRRLVSLLERGGQVKEALAVVEDWKRLAPGDQAAWLRRAELLQAEGEASEAVVELRRMVGKFGAEEDSRARLAAAMLGAGDAQGAMRIYEQLYEETEELGGKLKWVGELAKVAQQEGKIEDLLEDFERRKRENPRSAAPLLAMAEVHQLLNQYEERRSALLEASRRRPDDLDLMRQIADVEVRAGEFERALEILRDAAKRDRTPETKRKMARLLLANGEISSGLELLGELPDEREDPRQIEKTVIALIQATEWEAAESYLAKLMVVHPEDWRLKYLHGMILAENGQTEAAWETFLDLQQVKGEIKGLVPLMAPVAGNPVRNYWTPPEGFAMDGWLEFQQITQYVQNNRNSIRYNRRSSRMMGNQVAFSLPGSVREAQLMATLEAGQLLKQFPEGEKESRLARIRLEGVEELELLLAQMTQREEFLETLDERIEKDPENLKLLFLCYQYFSYELSDKRAEQLERFAKLCAEEHPRMFAWATSRLVAAKKMEVGEVFAELLKRYPDLEEEDREIYQRVFGQLVSQSLANGEKGEIDAIVDLLLEEALAVEEKPKNVNSHEMALSLALLSGRGKEAVILANRLCKWLEGEPVASRGGGYYSGYSGSGYISYGWGGRGQPSPLVPPPFPPAQMTGKPNAVASLVTQKLRNVQNASAEANQRDAELLAKLTDQEKDDSKDETKIPADPLVTLRGHLAELDDPLLRALVAAVLGENEALAEQIALMENSQDAEELLFAAGYYAKEGEDGKAYALVKKLRVLPLSREVRKAVDGHLAFLGAKLAGEESEIDLEAARRAALRLRKVMAGDQRAALLGVLDGLGLEKEAEKLANKPTPTAGARIGAAMGGLSQRRNGTQLVMQLVGEGKKEAAAREAAKALRDFTKQQSEYDIRNLLETVRKVQLEDELLKLLDPGDAESVTRRLLYADTARGLMKLELARPIYQKILEDRPDDFKARLGLLTTTPPEERDFSTLLPKGGEALGEREMDATLELFWSAAQRDYEASMTFAGIMAEILERQTPSADAKVNLSWAPFYSLQLASSAYYDGIVLSNLLRADPRELDEKGKEMDERRKKLLRRVFEMMLRHPQTAEQGFMLLEAARESLELKEDELTVFAKQAAPEVLRRVDNERQRIPWNKYSGNGSSGAGSLDDGISPMIYLGQRGELRELLTNELLENLKKNDPKRFEMIALVREMTDLPEAEALAKFETWKETNGEDQQKVIDLASNLLLLWPEDAAWIGELEKLLLAEPVNNRSSANFFTGSSSSQWLLWISEKRGKKGIEEFLAGVCRAFLGPEEKWPVLAELGYSKIPNDYQQKLNLLREALSQFSRSDDAMMPVMTLTIRHDFEKILQSFNWRQFANNAISRYSNDSDVYAWLKRVQFLDKAADGELDPARILIVSEGLSQLRHWSEDWRKEVAKKVLADEEFDPLLASLFAAMLLDEGPESLPTLLNDHLELMKATLEKSPDYFGPLLEELFGRTDGDASETRLSAILAELEATRREEVLEKSKKWLVDGYPVDPNDYEGQQAWREILALGQVDPRLAGKIAARTLEVVGRVPSSSSGSYNGIPYKRIDSWADEFIEAVNSEQNKLAFAGRALVLHQFYSEPSTNNYLNPGAMSGNIAYYFSNALRKDLARLKAPEGTQLTTLATLFEQWADDGEMSEPERSTLAALTLMAGSNSGISLNKEQLDATIKWADQELRKKSPVLADGLISLAITSFRGSDREERYETGREHFAAFLSEGEIPVEVSVDMVIYLLNDISWLFESEESWQWIAGVVREFGEGDRNFALSSLKGFARSLVGLEWTPGKETLAGVVDALAKTIYSSKVMAALPAGNRSEGLREFIDLAINAERLEVIAPLLRRRDPELQANLNLLLALTRAGEDKLASGLGVPANVAYSAAGLPPFSKALAGDLPKVLALVPERDRYRIEVIFSSQPDAEDEEAPAVKRGARLQELAKRFDAEAPQLRVPRWQILSALSREQEAVKVIGETISKEAANLNLATAITLKNESDSRQEGEMIYQMIKTSLRLDLENDLNDRPMTYFESMIGMTGNNATYYGGQAADDLIGIYWRNYLRQAAVSQEAAAALIPQANRLYKAMLEYGRRSRKMMGTRGMTLAIHTLAGNTAGFYSLVDELSDAHKKADEELRKGKFGRNFSGLGDETWLGDEYAPLRRRILAAFLTDPVILEKEILHLTELSSLFDEKLATQEEVCQAIEELPEDHPRKAEFLCEKAGILAWRDWKIDEADALYQRAYELAEMQQNEFAKNHIWAYRGLMLEEHERVAEAWQYGKSVDVELLPEQDRQSFTIRLGVWEKAATQE